jgi:hypothetical protein
VCGRLILSSCLPFFAIDAQCPVGMVTVCVHLMSMLATAPYVRKTDDVLAVTVQVHIFLLLCIAFVLQQTPFEIGRWHSSLFVCLFVVCLLPLTGFCLCGVVGCRFG